MAGSVGGAVSGCPGYAGYVPSCQQPLTMTNSSVTTRMNLVDRVNPSQSIGLQGTATLCDDDILRDPSVIFAPKRTTEKTLYASQGATRPDPGDWPGRRTKTRVGPEANGTAGSGGVPFQASSTYGNSFATEKRKDPQFYSNVQKAEFQAAEQDQQKVMRNTRSSAKQEVPTIKKLDNRTKNPAMEPPRPEFESTERRAALRNDAAKPQEFVKFLGAHVSVASSQREYGVRGYKPKDHIPSSAGEMSKTSTTGDLLAGTAKSTLGLRIPGYLGHVPSGRGTAATMEREGRPDLLKLNAQNTRIICTSRKTLPGYSGYEPKSLVNDSGRPNRPDVGCTSSGTSSCTALHASKEEKAMNNTEFAKQGGIRKFFTQGDGQPDHSISEQYFVKYRPMEGSLKMGAPFERSIPRTK